MSALENFETKMVILRYINNSDPQTNSVAEFTVDEEGITLDDVVMDSIRTQFSRLDSIRYSMDCPGGNLTLLKILKSLKQNGWNVVTSHSFNSTSKSTAMETIFYYEKFIVQNGAQQYQRQHIQVQHHSSGTNKHLSGVEEAKSQHNIYATKPLPNVPTKPSSTEDSSEDVSQRRISASVTSNRDKLLMKYNQHRRVSSRASTDSASEPSPADSVHVRSVNQLAKSYTMPASSSTTATTTAATAVNSNSEHIPVSASTPSSNSAPIMVPAPSPISINNTTVQPTSNEMPKLGAASAYPSLVRRIASKGFVAAPVATVENRGSMNASAENTGIASTQPTSAQSTVSSNSSSGSNPSATAPTTTTPVPVQTSARPPPIPPPLPPAAAPPPQTAAPAPVSVPVPPPVPAPVSVPPPVPAPVPVPPPVTTPASVPPPSSTPIPPPVSVPVPVPSSASVPAPPPPSSDNPLSVSTETDSGNSDSHPHDETSFQSSSNPLSSNSPVRGITSAPSFRTTADNDPHETNRTNHYSKLGSAFLIGGNALGPGARRAGRGLGPSTSMYNMK